MLLKESLLNNGLQIDASSFSSFITPFVSR
jgi:hypothetical protein